MNHPSFHAAAAMHRSGKVQEADPIYEAILARQPSHPDALHLLGLAMAQLGRETEGIALIQRAIKIRAGVPGFHASLGYALLRARRRADAVAAYRRALKLNPNEAGTWWNLGRALSELGDKSAAIDTYRQAIRLKVDMAEAHNSLGDLLRERKEVDQAISCFSRAIELIPEFAEAHHNLSMALAEAGRVDEAIESESTASRLAPEVTSCLSGRVYLLHFHPKFDRAMIRDEMKQYEERFATSLYAGHKPRSNSRDPEKRLKIGYVSPDFFFQAECFFLLPFLQAHDHKSFEVHCYSSVTTPDHITARFKKCADVWHDVVDQSNETLAQTISADGIDILVDLTMHMRSNRLPLFARKPAPIQVTWLAYPGGTGLSAIDYRLTDAYLDPPDCDEFYAERSVRLPGCWCCYSPQAQMRIELREKPFVRFASLNNPAKLNDPTLMLWSRVLAAVRDSRLLTLCHSLRQRQRIVNVFAAAGIAGDRIEFTGYQNRVDYLARHNQIDACLDPMPYNGITTSLDALWMGVPVITLVGQTAPSRAGLSLLTNAGLSEFVAQSAEEFVAIAARGKFPSREAIRQKLQDSPIFNARQFAGNVERAFRQMWQTYVTDSPTP
jgi:protein O-GlcNAc transferase